MCIVRRGRTITSKGKDSFVPRLHRLLIEVPHHCHASTISLLQQRVLYVLHYNFCRQSYVLHYSFSLPPRLPTSLVLNPGCCWRSGRSPNLFYFGSRRFRIFSCEVDPCDKSNGNESRAGNGPVSRKLVETASAEILDCLLVWLLVASCFLIIIQ